MRSSVWFKVKGIWEGEGKGKFDNFRNKRVISRGGSFCFILYRNWIAFFNFVFRGKLIEGDGEILNEIKIKRNSGNVSVKEWRYYALEKFYKFDGN